MSSIAMSNETDLDWLARVLHKWPDGDGITLLGRGRSFFDTGVGRSVHVYAVDGSDYTTIKEKDWLARRAELQNKPSWDDFGESAKFMAQDSDGAWMAFESEPAANYHVWSSMRGWCGYAREGRDRCRGEVLGDWRDTLEKRPEQTIADICREVTGENRHEEIFEPFVSIEDSQEKEMKQDNKWFERGELPPVGTVCEALWNEGRMEYLRTKVFGVNEHGQPIHRFDEGPNKFEYQADPLVTILGTRVFRPIRAERDVLLSIIVEEMNRYDTDGKLADAILAAGFSLRDK